LEHKKTDIKKFLSTCIVELKPVFNNNDIYKIKSIFNTELKLKLLANIKSHNTQIVKNMNTLRFIAIEILGTLNVLARTTSTYPRKEKSNCEMCSAKVITQ